MSLIKAWSADKLKKKFVVAENLQNLFPKVSDSVYFQTGKRFFFPWRVGDLTLFEALTGRAFDRLNWQHSGGFGINRYIISR